VIGRHAQFPSVHFAGGAAGLPWAAALGRHLATRILEEAESLDLDAVLSVQRRFPIGAQWHPLMGTPAAFALSHGWLKFSAK
jgi:glycine/D-amino acid oxidase-like deaminating enzyme